MIGSEYFPGAFPDNDASGHRIASRDAWHDRPIRDTEVLDAVDAEATVDDR